MVIEHTHTYIHTMPQLHLSLHKFQGSIEDPTETTYTVDARRFNYPTGDISADALGDWVRENEAERFDRLYIDVFHWVFTHAAETLSIHVVCQSGRTRSLGVLHALRQKLYRDVEHEIVVHLNEENVSVHTVTEPIPSAGQKRKAEEDDDSRPLKKDSRQVTLFGTVATRKGPRQRKITASERVSTRSQPVLHSPYFIQPVAPVTDPDFHTVDVEAARELLRENEALPFGWLNLDARLATWPLPAAEAYYAAEQTRQTWTQIDQPHTELEQYSKDYTKVRSKALIHASMIHLPCGGSPNYMDFQEEIALRAGLNPELLGVFKKPKTAEEKAIEDANFAEGHAAEEAMRDEWRDKWGLITTKTGIWYNPDLPESSGSPDGIVECEPKAVIEFKWNTDRKKDRRAENQSAYVMQVRSLGTQRTLLRY